DVEASHWLHALYQHRVLETYAEAGNLQMKDVLERWNVAGDRFDQAWKDGVALIKSRRPPRGTDEAVNWDAAMFGHLDPTPPSIVGLHARLLAMAYDANWAERLRQRLLAEFAALVVHCPWLKELGDPLQMNAASLLVLEALLPEAKQVADKQIKADIRRREEAAEEARSLRRDLDQIVTGLRATTQRTLPTDDLCDVLLADLGRYFGLVATVRGSGRSDEGWVELRNAAIRMEPVARRMQRLGERLRERLAVSGGWLNARTVVPLLLLLFLVPRLGARIIIPLIILVPLGIIGWQLVPNFMMLIEIRDLAEKL
ncbi:MAG: hypothetical protein ABJB04_07505, partial [Betaproteobacteria bacterium]